MASSAFADWREALCEAGAALEENLVLLDRVDSTNAFARRLLRGLPLEAYPPAPTFVVAHRQTRGRGRLDRRWESPAGLGLYATYVRALDREARIDLLPLAVGVTVCAALRGMGATACQLKWPNDLVTERGKLGGLLIESAARSPEREAVLIVGVGLNLRDERRRLTRLGATTLEAEGLSPTAAEVFTGVAARLVHLEERTHDAAALVSEYRRLLRHRPGDRLAWRQGEESLTGRFLDIDEGGRLLLETEEGRRSVAVGDIIEP